MSKSTARPVCRLLGGTGRPQPVAVSARKLPALFVPFDRTDRAPVATVVRLPRALPLAA